MSWETLGFNVKSGGMGVGSFVSAEGPAVRVPRSGCQGGSEADTVFSVRCGGNRHDLGGEDRLEGGFCVRWDESRRDVLFAELEAAKEKAKNEPHSRPCVVIRDLATGKPITVGAVACCGRRGGPYFYDYTVEILGGVKLWISRRARMNEKTPTILYAVGAVPLMVLGTEEAYRRILKVVESLGCTIERESLSRVDPEVDLKGVSPAEFIDALERRCVVKRPRDAQYYMSGHKKTALVLGSNDLMLRIYDKVKECRGAEKWPFMVAHRWNGEEPSEATRVEYQIRRPVLREMGVVTVADWLKRRDEIMKYLCDEWFRLTEEPPDSENGHQQRAVTSALWRRVVSAFQGWVGFAQRAVVRVRRVQVGVGNLLRQALGCIVTAMARVGLKEGDAERVFMFLGENCSDGEFDRALGRLISKQIDYEKRLCFT